MERQTLYRVAGESLLVEAEDSWAAAAIETHFTGLYLTPVRTAEHAGSMARIVMSSQVRPAPIPRGLDHFAVAGGGTCYTDGRSSYVEIDGSVVTIGEPGGAVEVRMNGTVPLDAPSLTRAVTYALSAALRQRRRFELHSAAMVDPVSGRGVLMVGPSGSCKSTLSVHLASAGWPFLTDDVLLLGQQSAEVSAWALRRCFAVTPQTFAASRVLQSNARVNLERRCDKQPFLPHEVFAAEFMERCVPLTLVFPALSGTSDSRVTRLTRADTMARLIRMSPWCCYDRSTAPHHLAVLSALAAQTTGYSLLAGTDLLDPEAAVTLIAACTRES